MHIFPVKPNYGPKLYLCSPQGHGLVKIKRPSFSRAVRIPSRFISFALFLLALGLASGSMLAQAPQINLTQALTQSLIVNLTSPVAAI